jgi:hypothetical protein
VASRLPFGPHRRPPRELHRFHRPRHQSSQRRLLIRSEIQERGSNRTRRPAKDAQARLDDADRVAATLVPQGEIGDEEIPHRFAHKPAVARMDGGEEALGVFG